MTFMHHGEDFAQGRIVIYSKKTVCLCLVKISITIKEI